MLNNLNIRTLDWPWLTFRVSVRSVYGQIDFNISPIYIDFPEKKEISLPKSYHSGAPSRVRSLYFDQICWCEVMKVWHSQKSTSVSFCQSILRSFSSGYVVTSQNPTKNGACFAGVVSWRYTNWIAIMEKEKWCMVLSINNRCTISLNSSSCSYVLDTIISITMVQITQIKLTFLDSRSPTKHKFQSLTFFYLPGSLGNTHTQPRHPRPSGRDEFGRNAAPIRAVWLCAI